MSAASEENFKVIDPQRSNMYRIARQMENQEIVHKGELCPRSYGNLSLTGELKMKTWAMKNCSIMNSLVQRPPL